MQYLINIQLHLHFNKLLSLGETKRFFLIQHLFSIDCSLKANLLIIVHSNCVQILYEMLGTQLRTRTNFIYCGEFTGKYSFYCESFSDNIFE